MLYYVPFSFGSSEVSSMLYARCLGAQVVTLVFLGCSGKHNLGINQKLVHAKIYIVSLYSAMGPVVTGVG
eukprot:2406398-Pyramimonas_sp.AAC.1